MIFTDTETTGLLKADAANLNLQPFITEIYAVKLDDDLNFVEELDTLVKPPVPIPEHITKITGISDDTVATAPSFIEVYDKLIDLFLGQRVVVGHNIPFDLGVIWCELARHSLQWKFPWPPTWICTIEKSMPIENRRLSLKNLYLHATGRPHEGAHRAKVDVAATIECYKFLMKQGLI